MPLFRNDKARFVWLRYLTRFVYYIIFRSCEQCDDVRDRFKIGRITKVAGSWPSTDTCLRRTGQLRKKQHGYIEFFR